MKTIVKATAICGVSTMQYLLLYSGLVCECIHVDISYPSKFSTAIFIIVLQNVADEYQCDGGKAIWEAFNIKYDWKKMLPKEVF